MDMTEKFATGDGTFNWDLYDYLLLAPERELTNCHDCVEKRFALTDRSILNRAKAALKTIQFRTVALKIDHATYQMNREWIDPMLADARTPLDEVPFESLTIYLDVKLPCKSKTF